MHRIPDLKTVESETDSNEIHDWMMSMVSIGTPIRGQQITIMNIIKMPDTPSNKQAMTPHTGSDALPL